MDRGPTSNRAGVKSESFFERVFRQFVDRVANMLPDTRDINETKIENLRVVFRSKSKYAFGVPSLSFDRNYWILDLGSGEFIESGDDRQGGLGSIIFIVSITSSI
jgi:hypothetical protein